jgi:hypothetical protein
MYTKTTHSSTSYCASNKYFGKKKGSFLFLILDCMYMFKKIMKKTLCCFGFLDKQDIIDVGYSFKIYAFLLFSPHLNICNSVLYNHRMTLMNCIPVVIDNPAKLFPYFFVCFFPN